MAVDANVLIYERIREELRTARGPARAIDLGFEKAFSPILDGNVTTLIVAIILYVMGSGPVRGFGITLALGLICSMFTAISLSRLLDRHVVRPAASEDADDLRGCDALPADLRDPELRLLQDDALLAGGVDPRRRPDRSSCCRSAASTSASTSSAAR